MHHQRPWILVCVLLMTACAPTATPPEGTTAPSAQTTQTTREPDSTTTDPVPEVMSADTVPLSGEYGFISIEISDASLANIAPASYLDDSPVAAQDRYLFLTMEVDNTSRGFTANWLPSPYGLLIEGELASVPEMVEGRPNVGLTAGQSAEVVLAYPVDADVTFEDLTFTFAAEGTIPLLIPIDGQPDPWPWPIEVPLTATGELSGDGVSCGQSLTVDVGDGSVSVDLLDTEGIVQGSRRALEGERFLTVPGRVTNHGGQRCGGGATNVTGDTVRLYVDGVPRPPVGFVNVSIAQDAAEDFRWHFAYPTDASELVFVFGDPDTANLTVPVDVTGIP